LPPTSALADDPPVIRQLDVAAVVANDGKLKVKETIFFRDGVPDTFTQRLATSRLEADNWQYHFVIENLAVETGQDFSTESKPESLTVNVATENAGGADADLVISYTVVGAAIQGSQGDTVLTWDLVQGMNATVMSVDAQVNTKAQYSSVDCAAGNPGDPSVCTFYGGGTHDYPAPTFHQDNLAPGQVLRATLRFDAGLIQVNQELVERWSLDRAFTPGLNQLGLSALILLGGGLILWLVHRRIGRDAISAELVPVAQFHPIAENEVEFRVLNGIRPGLVGTVLDEHVDPIDITATLLDLAVRGHLLIRELPRPSAYAPTDWSFSRRPSAEPLDGFERTLLDQVAPEDGTEVFASELSASVVPAIVQIQAQMYADVVSRGWFHSNPQKARRTWGRLAFGLLAAAVTATIFLAAFTSYALPGVALAMLGVIGIFVSAEMPAKTAAGVGLVDGLAALRSILAVQSVDQLPPGREIAQISALLPYAVVLGGLEKWINAIALFDSEAVDDSEEIEWYHAPKGWTLADLPASLRSFVITVQGTLFTRA
jgi:hypothetical protein